MSGKNNILIRPVFAATITIFPSLFEKALYRWLKVNKFRKTIFLSTYFHLDELLSHRGEFFIKNLFCIQRMAHLDEREIYFLTPSRCLDILDNLLP